MLYYIRNLTETEQYHEENKDLYAVSFAAVAINPEEESVSADYAKLTEEIAVFAKETIKELANKILSSPCLLRISLNNTLFLP